MYHDFNLLFDCDAIARIGICPTTYSYFPFLDMFLKYYCKTLCHYSKIRDFLNNQKQN